MEINDEPKNLRLSIHNKYKRRLRALSLSVSDFLAHADMKLDTSISGKIYKREEIEKIAAKARELAALLPDPGDALDFPPIRDDFLDVLQQTAGDTDRIIANAEAFFKGLSKDEWDEMCRAYTSKT